MKDEACSECKFWPDPIPPGTSSLEVEDLEGRCRRHPPVYVGTDSEPRANAIQCACHWVQPVTFGNDWCGEFRRKS